MLPSLPGTKLLVVIYRQGPLTVTFCAVSGKATAIHKKANPFSLFLMIK